MTVRNLDALFAPRSVVLAGGSPRSGSVGRTVLANLRAGAFGGFVGLVNPDHAEIDGLQAAKTFADLSEPPDLVVATAPATALPKIVEQAGAAGARAIVVMTLSPLANPAAFRKTLLDAARRKGVRLVGPGGLGIQSPHVRLNASAAEAAAPGELGLISQSGGVMSSMAAWANSRSIGFSGLVSLGDSIDVDVDDMLDHFAIDRRTRAILLYLDDIGDAARFMSAARAAARIKPVVVVKASRPHSDGAASGSLARALIDRDVVCDAAFRRAGLLRVAELSELFAAAETLAHAPPLAGKRVAIASNSGALGALAHARLTALGGVPARLTPETEALIEAALPSEGFAANPLDLCGDAGGERYAAALDGALDDSGVDAAIAIHAPSRISPAGPCAKAVAEATTRARAKRFPPKPVFAAFLGAETSPRRTLEAAHVPAFRTPEAAVEGLMHLVRHVEAQEALLATPPSAPEDFTPDVTRARAAIASGFASGEEWLAPTDVAEVLLAYGVPTLPQAVVATPEEAAEVASALSGPRGAALKIVSPDLPRRALVGGVRLALEGREAVLEAAHGMLARAAERAPSARIDGFLVQPYVRPDDGQEIYLGIADDPTFGPVVAFGAGGGAAALRRDVSAALPPLHMGFARELIDRTIAGRLLGGHDDRAPADRDVVARILVRIAQLAVDLPELRELEINPLVATPRGAVAFDARIRVAPAPAARGLGVNPRLAIRPYPKAYERTLELKDGASVELRPVRPEDEETVAAFFRNVAPDDLRQRFFTPVVQVPRVFIARLTQIDYARAFVLLALSGGRVVGLVQLHADPDLETGEYAILLAAGEKGRGLGRALMRAMIDVARSEGLATVTGEVLTENGAMLSLCRSLGFEVKPDPDDHALRRVRLELSEEAKTP